MLLKMSKIGKQKISYKSHDSIEFDTLQEYLVMARKAISKLANTVFEGLSKKMLKDEDAISTVATAIMMGDWRWDENYQNKKNTKKGKYSYRNQCALWAIQTYATQMYKKPKNVNRVLSLDFELSENGDSLSSHEVFADENAILPEEKMIETEKTDGQKRLIEDIFDSASLTDRQKEQVRLYYIEDMTFEEIGEKFGITREAVRQSVKKSMEKIQEVKDEFSCSY